MIVRRLLDWQSRRRTPRSPGLRGGLALPRDKPGLDRDIVEVPLPRVLVLPLVGHGGRTLAPMVAVGDRVARGQSLGPGLLASAAATVTAIEARPIAHPAGRPAPCVVLTTDAIDAPDIPLAATFPEPLRPTLPPLERLTRERLTACAVTGLGGAGFPTPDKLVTDTMQALVVNGAECEPGIACDEALMQVAAGEIVAGALALARLVSASRCLLVIEDDKVAAKHALRAAIATQNDGTEGLEPRLVTIAPRYPSGAERLLIRLATGIDVPGGERPADHGVLCVNVATARAAHRARLGEPLLSRIVTVAGGRAQAPCNARVPFGTSFAAVLDATGQRPRADDTRCRSGGALSGFDVAYEQVAVTATVNRIAVEPPLTSAPSSPCIRCAACSDVCPVALLPQALLHHARADATTAAEGIAIRGTSIHRAALDRGGLGDCLECGCCDLVCPSSIPLTATFRHARGVRRNARRNEADAARAEDLHRRRETRLATRVTQAPVARPVPSAGSALERARARRRRSRARENGDR